MAVQMVLALDLFFALAFMSALLWHWLCIWLDLIVWHEPQNMTQTNRLFPQAKGISESWESKQARKPDKPDSREINKSGSQIARKRVARPKTTDTQ